MQWEYKRQKLYSTFYSGSTIIFVGSYLQIRLFSTTKEHDLGSGIAKGGRSAPGGTFMGAALWATLWVINLQELCWNKSGFNVGTLLAVEGRFWFWVI